MNGTNELTGELRARHGIGPEWWFGKRFELRWGETDPFGHANHLTHLVWCEEVRNAYLAALGHGLRSADLPGPVMKRLDFSYARPLRLHDDVVVTARAEWVRRTSFQMEYAVWSNGLVGSGHAICVWFINSTGLSVEVPDDLRRQMAERDGCRDLRTATR